MKKSTLIIALIFAVISGFAQKGKVSSAENLANTDKLKEALETIELTVDPSNEKSEKTIDWPRTWEVRGDIYQKIYQSEDESVKSLVEEPLTVALESFKKALELDEKNRIGNSVKIKLTLLINDLTNQAVQGFNNENYELALKSFKQIMEINNLDIIKADNPDGIDTVLIFNTALAAYNAEIYDDAITYYKQAANYGYNGARTYNLLANTYQIKKDTLEALKVLQEGFEKYPEDNGVLTSMIQIYLDLDKTDDAMKYLNLAIEQDPSNATFYFARGTLYEKLGDEENAIDSYNSAIEADNKYFDAYYNLGAMYYNKGVKQIEVANAVPANENEKYEAELEKADEWFKQALPYMEKCYEIEAEHPMTLESLKNLYYRLKMMDKYNEIVEKIG
jgi:tetratricopeptide (TPR) repeat protein